MFGSGFRIYNAIAARPLALALAGFILLLAMVFPPVTISSGASMEALSEAAVKREEKAVLEAARDYLEAEVSQDHPAVFASFAPSSPYLRTHDYAAYLGEVREAPDRLVAYNIVAVSYIQINENKDVWPAVEKFAQVEVDMVFEYLPTAQRSEINIGLIFFKEGGKWYKS